MPVAAIKGRWQKASVLGVPTGYEVARGLGGGVAAGMVGLAVPVSAAAARVTYGGRGVGGAGGQPGGGGGPLGAGALALAEVPLPFPDQCPLVALHPLQLLLRCHSATGRTNGGLQGLSGG